MLFLFLDRVHTGKHIGNFSPILVQATGKRTVIEINPSVHAMDIEVNHE